MRGSRSSITARPSADQSGIGHGRWETSQNPPIEVVARVLSASRRPISREADDAASLDARPTTGRHATNWISSRAATPTTWDSRSTAVLLFLIERYCCRRLLRSFRLISCGGTALETKSSSTTAQIETSTPDSLCTCMRYNFAHARHLQGIQHVFVRTPADMEDRPSGHSRNGFRRP